MSQAPHTPRRSSVRLDELLVARGLAPDLHAACASILAGEVVVGEHRQTHAGTRVPSDAAVRLKAGKSSARGGFASRGGLKLQGALDAFRIPVEGRSCADIGCSTGGFTDCLLTRGAAHVLAVDVGRADFDWRLRGDSRVTLLERTDARDLAPASLSHTPCDLVVCDLSFIRLASVLPAMRALLDEQNGISGTGGGEPPARGEPRGRGDEQNGISGTWRGGATGGGEPPARGESRDGGEPAARGELRARELVALVKPQFELPHGVVPAGGVVGDPDLHVRVLETLAAELADAAFKPLAWCHSPVRGAKGNIEYFVHARPTPDPSYADSSYADSSYAYDESTCAENPASAYDAPRAYDAARASSIRDVVSAAHEALEGGAS